MINNLKLLIFVALFFITSCGLPPGRDSNLLPENQTKGVTKVRLYFTKTKSNGDIVLVKLIRKVPKQGSLIKNTLQELLAGPSKIEQTNGIMSEIPEGTRLIKVEEGPNDILVDLSSQYLVSGGSASVQLRYLQLYNTLNLLEPDKKVYLHVDGKTLTSISGEGLEVTQPLSKIEDYTKKFEKTDDIQP